MYFQKIEQSHFVSYWYKKRVIWNSLKMENDSEVTHVNNPKYCHALVRAHRDFH